MLNIPKTQIKIITRLKDKKVPITFGKSLCTQRVVKSRLNNYVYL